MIQSGLRKIQKLTKTFISASRKSILPLWIYFSLNLSIAPIAKAGVLPEYAEKTYNKCLIENNHLGEQSRNYCNCLIKQTYVYDKDVFEAGIECNRQVMGINISPMDARASYRSDSSFKKSHMTVCLEVVKQGSSYSDANAKRLCECTLEKWLSKDITRREAFASCRNDI